MGIFSPDIPPSVECAEQDLPELSTDSGVFAKKTFATDALHEALGHELLLGALFML